MQTTPPIAERFQNSSALAAKDPLKTKCGETGVYADRQTSAASPKARIRDNMTNKSLGLGPVTFAKILIPSVAILWTADCSYSAENKPANDKLSDETAAVRQHSAGESAPVDSSPDSTSGTTTSEQTDHRKNFSRFSNVQIADEFAPVIGQGEIILENGGGKIVKMPDDTVWIVGVGVTAVKSGSGPMETIRQRTVAEQKARKAVVAELEATRIAAKTSLTSTTTVHESNGVETASSSDEIVDLVQSDVEGIISGLEAAGTWFSQDGQLFHLALCKRLR